MKSPLVIDINYDYSADMHYFDEALADRTVFHLSQDNQSPSEADLSGIKYAMVWKPNAELFNNMPDLEVVFSLGAGVDHVLELPIPDHVPIVRFVDPTLTTRMSEWICLQCLMHLRRQREFDALQKKHRWEELHSPMAQDVTVGIMGLGVLGQDAACKLATIGFDVIGWSRSKRIIDGMETFDAGGLQAFLNRTDILVGLLPLTDETRGMFDYTLFAKLRGNKMLGGPFFINAGRGASQVEADIKKALSDGTLKGASVDVFEAEPLSSENPLWALENLIVTPHVAAISGHDALAAHVARQISRYEGGEGLEHLVDRQRGY